MVSLCFQSYLLRFSRCLDGMFLVSAPLRGRALSHFLSWGWVGGGWGDVNVHLHLHHEVDAT